MDFSILAVNWLAVLVSGVAYFMVGAVWYGIFAGAWMKGIGKTREELSQSPVQYILSFVSEVLIAFFVAVSLNAFATASVGDAIFVGAVLWFGFSLLPAIVHYLYEGLSFSLLAINKGYDLLGVLIGAIILQLW